MGTRYSWVEEYRSNTQARMYEEAIVVHTDLQRCRFITILFPGAESQLPDAS